MAWNADSWSIALWNYFEPQVKLGSPLYLAADGELISQILSSATGFDVTIEEATESFHLACNALFEKTEYKAAIKETAFQRIPGKSYSRAICLAVQQVLVVELMLNDNIFSENSYFPRYRNCLGVSDAQYGQNNPLGYDFQKIWDYLESELNLTAGASQSTVTFYNGKGKDLNRMLPLSQALFTSHDLTIIQQALPEAESVQDERILIQMLYRIKNKLSKRSQSLIESDDRTRASRLCKQVISFMKDFRQLSSLRIQESLNENEQKIVAFLDPKDFFDDSFTFNLYIRTKNQQETGEVLHKALTERLKLKTYVTLMSKDDGYVELGKTDIPNYNDSFILVTKLFSKNKLKEEILNLSSDAVVTECFTNLPNGMTALLLEALSDAAINKMISNRRSQLETRKSLQLYGGLLVDGRSNTYLSGYPPSSVAFLDSTYSGQLLVNRKAVDCDAFFKSLTEQRESMDFEITIKNEVIEFSMAAYNPVRDLYNGNAFLLTNGELSLSPVPVMMSKPFLLGTYFHFKEVEEKLASIQLPTNALNFLSVSGARRPVSELMLKVLIDGIKNLENVSPLKNTVIKQIQISRSVPKTASVALILNRIHKALIQN